MKSTIKSGLLAALLAMLVASASAQNQASSNSGEKSPAHSNVAPRKAQKRAPAHNTKAARGEAARLETKEADLNDSAREMRDDNRGRPASAHPHSTLHAVNRTAQHSATLKTGQLTTKQRSQLATKETALHRPIHSDQTQNQKLKTDDASSTDGQNKNTSPIHLKKHNARMF